MNNGAPKSAGNGADQDEQPSEPKLTPAEWLAAARPSLAAAASELQKAIDLEEPETEANRLAFQTELIREELIDVHVRMSGLIDRADVEATEPD